jgi:hypothetical protein
MVQRWGCCACVGIQIAFANARRGGDVSLLV